MKSTRACKVCQRPVTLEVFDDVVEFCNRRNCQQELLAWISKLSPMVTCNRCYDMICKRKDIMQRIYDDASKLIAGVDTKEEKAGIRMSLCRSTQDFGQVMAHYLGLDQAFWAEDFVDVIFEQPNRVKTILSSYETLLRQHASKQAA